MGARKGANSAAEFVAALKRCSKTRDLLGGQKLHCDAVANGCHTNKYVAAALIRMYSKCRSMPLAREVFDGTTFRNVVMWTCLLLGYVENGQRSVAMDLFSSMDCAPDSVTYVAVLKACGGLAMEKESEKLIFLDKGIAIHRELKDRGFDCDMYVASTLLDMYGKCGDMQRARQVFDRMVFKDVVTWNSLVLGYVDNGYSSLAVDLLTTMDCEPDRVTYIIALRAFAGLASDKQSERQTCLEKGVTVHMQLKYHGLDSDIVVATTLLDMYSKCGSMQHAREVFEKMVVKDVVTWTCLILGYVENGEGTLAMDLFAAMDCEPNHLTYVAVLKACACLAPERQLEKAVVMEKQIKACGLDSDMVVTNALLDMYGKCGCMQDAQRIFDNMTRKGVVTWTSLILGYVENGESAVALDLFTSMDCEPNHVTYIAALKACVSLAVDKQSEKQVALEKGISIHRQLRGRGFDNDIVVANTLLDMYGKCGSMHHARGVFHCMISKDVVSWTSFILGYVENGENAVALDLFTRMEGEPDPIAYIAALKACAGLAGESVSEKQIFLDKGTDIHRRLKNSGLDSEIFVASALLDMYRKCGAIRYAQNVFDKMVHKDVVLWTSLILGYVENGESRIAMNLFTSMDCQPNHFTYIAVMKACASLATESESEKQIFLERGITIHRQIKNRGFDSEIAVANTLLDMYGRLGYMERAREAFESMVYKDVVTWTSLMLGYVENGQSSAAMDLFASMDCEPNLVTYVVILKACGTLAAAPVGKLVHARVCEVGVEQNEVLATALMDFYGKCGCMATAQVLFDSMHHPNIIAWTSLMGRYSSVGDSVHVFSLTKKIVEAGLKLNDNTFICLLTTCSHMGLVKEGRMYFEYMMKCGINPTREHYTCMVDMLGRANMLNEALSIIRSMPFEANAVTWTTLLGACNKWNNLQVAKLAFDSLTSGSTTDAAPYVLMSDMLSMWHHRQRVEAKR